MGIVRVAAVSSYGVAGDLAILLRTLHPWFLGYGSLLMPYLIVVAVAVLVYAALVAASKADDAIDRISEEGGPCVECGCLWNSHSPHELDACRAASKVPK